MWLRWLPWKYIVRRMARAHGFLDPIKVYSYFRRFSQPSDVVEPMELLRAGVVLHARGLMNSRAIQHNLDWIWPFWVEKQFNPRDRSFVPRAFSLTHINLTHRNWTAVGVPDCAALPIVDPRGLVTPHLDGWSLDGWIYSDDGELLAPSKLDEVEQIFDLTDNPKIVTTSERNDIRLQTQSKVTCENRRVALQLTLRGISDRPGWLILSLRPYNPEGVSFIHQVKIDPARQTWIVDEKQRIHFDSPAERHALSTYMEGDVAQKFPEESPDSQATCDVGLATAAAMFRLEPQQPRELNIRVPLEEPFAPCDSAADTAEACWEQALAERASLHVPDPQFQFLFEAALRTMIMHSPGDVYPGSYTYKRFWFRDAAFILHAMLCTGLFHRSERVLDKFPNRQKVNGFFHSQEGEWDSNGEALWIMNRFCELTGRPPKKNWLDPIRRGASWIENKRLSAKFDLPHAGLFPAGFSAEHLGPNDYYYWDDFWGVAGLKAAAAMLQELGDLERAQQSEEEACRFMADIERSLSKAEQRLGRPAMPAAPLRRYDSGAIGSLAVGYPLMLWPRQDRRLLDTAEFLMQNFFVHGGFFQDMIHSGINPYLTLHIAQVLLRNGDLRFFELARTVAQLASPTGQWPEAVHPHTGGGCMGDGHHVWASAEWVMMIRNMFLYEEPVDEKLIVAAGIPPEWLTPGNRLKFGPAPTKWGEVTISIEVEADKVAVNWEAKWHKEEPPIEIRLPQFGATEAEPGQTVIQFEYEAAK